MKNTRGKNTSARKAALSKPSGSIFYWMRRKANKDYGISSEEPRQLYRESITAFDVNAPSYHIALFDKSTAVGFWIINVRNEGTTPSAGSPETFLLTRNSVVPTPAS